MRGAAAAVDVGRCTTAAPPMTDPGKGSNWNGWGGKRSPIRVTFPQHRGRHYRAARAAAEAEMGVRASRRDGRALARPVVVGGRLFVASEDGQVFSLNARTGCTYWAFHAKSGIRSAVSVGQYKGPRGTAPYAVFFTDFEANVYGVDANSGKQLWTRTVEDHPQARATGSGPTYYNGRLYVPMAGIEQKRPSAAARPTNAARCPAAASPRSTPTPARSCGRRSRSRRSRRSAG